MSYVRFGWGPNDEWPGTPEAEKAGPSSIYMFGTIVGDKHVIECCGCLLERADQFPQFSTVESVVAHLDAHRKAGHVVHDYVQPAIEADFEPGGWMAT